MAQSRKGHSQTADIFKKILLGLLIAGLGLALLRAFDYDPFGVIDWVFGWIMTAINKVADFFTNNSFFRDVTNPDTIEKEMI